MNHIVIDVPDRANNGDIFKAVFGMDPAEFWSMDTRQFSNWLNQYDYSKYLNLKFSYNGYIGMADEIIEAMKTDYKVRNALKRWHETREEKGS